MSDIQIRVPADEAEVEALCRIQSDAFGAPLERIQALMTAAPPDELRVVVQGRAVVGGLKVIKMGHWIGGRSVPTAGIAAVGVDPVSRGGGVALALMEHVVRECAERGMATTSLFPAVVPLYRAAGYELAGVRHEVTLDLAALRAGLAKPGLPAGDGPGLPVDEGAAWDGSASFDDGDVSVRAGTPDDDADTARAYARFARTQNGLLDRGPYVWNRARLHEGEPMRQMIVEGPGGIEGYCTWRSQSGLEDGMLTATDAVALTPAAARHVLGLFARHASLVQQASFFGAPGHPLMQLLPAWCARMTMPLPWMLRITDVRAALEARGWPAGLHSELHLHVHDPLVPGNARRWLLELDDGEARVSEGGQGLLQLDQRALAALLTSHLTPEALAVTGLLAGPPAERARLAAAFAGPAPWMVDMF